MRAVCFAVLIGLFLPTLALAENNVIDGDEGIPARLEDSEFHGEWETYNNAPWGASLNLSEDSFVLKYLGFGGVKGEKKGYWMVKSWAHTISQQYAFFFYHIIIVPMDEEGALDDSILLKLRRDGSLCMATESKVPVCFLRTAVQFKYITDAM